MNHDQKIACPSCSADIFFSVPLLITGASFACTQCQASIKLAGSSTTEVKASYEKYIEMKKASLTQQ